MKRGTLALLLASLFTGALVTAVCAVTSHDTSEAPALAGFEVYSLPTVPAFPTRALVRSALSLEAPAATAVPQPLPPDEPSSSDGALPPEESPPAAVASALPAAPPAPPPPSTKSAADLTVELISVVNAQRIGAGVPALEVDAALMKIAGARAEDMAQRGYFDHVSPTGESAASLAAGYGIPAAFLGENLGRNNYSDTETVAVTVESWMSSRYHRDNLLNGRFIKVGAGVAIDAAGMKYYCLVLLGS